MAQAFRRLLLIAIVVFAVVAVYGLRDDDQLILTESTGAAILPFDARSSLEIARGSGWFNRSSTYLICTAQQQVRLVLQTKMPERGRMEPGIDDQATLFVGGIETKLEFTRVRLISMDPVDTLVVEPLSQEHLRLLAASLRASASQRVSFVTMERAVFMTSLVSGDAVTKLVAECSAQASRKTMGAQ